MAAGAPRFWQQRGAKAIALLPLSALFTTLSSLRRLAYRSGLRRVHRLPVPVVVVGNIAVGGSGKTPVVSWLAERLSRAGFHPGIVSRGYGRTADDIACVGAGSGAAAVGDEPLLLARLTGCPVAVGRDRPAAAAHLLREHPGVDLILADDGLQHLALARDVEVVVIDEAGLGNRWPLPAGPLREGVARARRADLVITHGPLSSRLAVELGPVRQAPMVLEGRDFERLADRREKRSAADFAGARVHAVAGIGRPQRFFDQLSAMGLAVEPHPFPDHHAFSAADLAFAPGEPRILTEKDAVKCADFAPPDTWVFPVRASIPDAALQPILEKLARHGRQAA